jgi:DNA-binding transcriptional LysR family regulator
VSSDALSVFPISIVAGVTVSKWTTRWEERNPGRAVAVTVVRDEDQLIAVRDGTVACAFVRLPVPAEDPSATQVHAIPLYTEACVVVAAKGHLIEAADEVELADLAGDRLLSAPATLPGWAEVATDPGTAEQRAHLLGLTSEQLIDVVVTGAGIAVLPASIVRAYARKDLVWRPLSDAPQSTVAVVWRADDDSIDTERFVGIVRGRTARSSRAEPTPPTDRRKSSTVRQRSASSHAARRKRR